MLSVETLMQEARLSTGPRKRKSAALAREEAGVIAKAIDALPEKTRLAVALRFYEKLRPSEIGEVLGLTEEKAQQLLVEATRKVLERLQDHPSTPPFAVARVGRKRGGATRRS